MRNVSDELKALRLYGMGGHGKTSLPKAHKRRSAPHAG